MTHLDLRKLLPHDCQEVTISFPGGDLAVNVHTLAVRDLRLNSVQKFDLPGLVAQFLIYLEINEDMKPVTLLGYRQRLGQFVAWLDQTGCDPAQSATWQTYYGTLKDRQLSSYTRKGHYHILNRFGDWLVKSNHLRFDPFDTVHPPKPPKKNLQKAVVEEHIQAMFAAARQDKRDWAIFLFFRDTGCRANEALQLRWRDLRYLKRGSPGVVFVMGKNEQARPLFFGVETTKALLAYRRDVPHGPGDPVWWGKMRYTDKAQASPLTYSGLYKIFKRISNRAGLKGDIFSPHGWRHAFGRDMTKAGAPTIQLQDMMGHSTPAVTKIYTMFNTAELQQAHARYSPVDRDLSELREAGLLPVESEEDTDEEIDDKIT